MLGKLKLPLSFKGVTFTFVVYVVDRLPHSLIIGLDFFQKHQVTLNLADNTMSFYNDSANVCLMKTNGGLVRVAKSTTLPPFSENILSVKVSKRYSGEEVLLEPLPDMQTLNLLGAKCLVKVKNCQSVLKVLNPTTQEIRLPKGKVLAKVADFDHDAVLNFDDTDTSPSIHNNARQYGHYRTEHYKRQYTPELWPQSLRFINTSETQNDSVSQQTQRYFSTGYHELGQCNTYMNKIETDPNAKPIKMPFYRTTPKNHAEINRQVEDLLQNDIIQESNSEWHSPCLLVKEASGEFRLVTDFRRLNKNY